ncbi:MAG: hypothetical protein AB6733_24625 [Clostridiaceae bacterium]
MRFIGRGDFKGMNEEFYILDEDWEKGYAEAIEENNNPKITICKLCRGRAFSLTSNLKVHFIGKKIGDYYPLPGYSIINEKIYAIFKENNISGFEIKDIDITGWQDARGKRLKIGTHGLKEMIVTGNCGYLRKLNGDLIEKCESCGKAKSADREGVVGLKINAEDWDGSDICYFKNLRGRPVVTQKVKDILEKNKIKNVIFINIKDFEAD